MSCEECSRKKTIVLSTGVECCSFCRQHLLECEARFLLALPLQKRRQELIAREQKRGSVEDLKKAMQSIHAKKQREKNEVSNMRRVG